MRSLLPLSGFFLRLGPSLIVASSLIACSSGSDGGGVSPDAAPADDAGDGGLDAPGDDARPGESDTSSDTAVAAKCGFASTNPRCEACLEKRCCDAARTCAASETCTTELRAFHK